MSIFITIVELGDKLSDLVCDHADWSQATFGSDAERGPVGPLKHLEKEAAEARGAWLGAYEDDEIVEEAAYAAFKEELADCLLLLLDASRRGGVKVMQLIEAAQAKLEVNKKRVWPKASATEPVEHVKE